MADVEIPEGEAPKRGSKMPMLIGVLMALVLGGGAFYAVWSGLILAPATHETKAEAGAPDTASQLPDIAFVPVPPIVVNVSSSGQKRHLRFQAQLEVNSGAEEDVASVLPRVVDVLNGYLRAVESGELERQGALIRLRAQMLRRVQVVTGEGRVRDLLVMEFVLN